MEFLHLGKNVSPPNFLFKKKKNHQSRQYPQKWIFLISKGISDSSNDLKNTAQ